MELLDAHNKERTARGLTELVPNAKLMLAAQNHSDHMARVRRLGHFGIGDGSPSDRLNTVGYKAIAGGENVGAGQTTVAQIMRDWMNSSGHRKAILGNYKEYGGAVAKGSNGVLYWTSCFGTPGKEDLVVIGMVRENAPAPIIISSTENGYLIPPYEECADTE